jgi:hypothetical protein
MLLVHPDLAAELAINTHADMVARAERKARHTVTATPRAPRIPAAGLRRSAGLALVRLGDRIQGAGPVLSPEC